MQVNHRRPVIGTRIEGPLAPSVAQLTCGFPVISVG
jgi:hypothetical protein